jgi:transcriptional regulator GlxA family with amidase domain
MALLLIPEFSNLVLASVLEPLRAANRLSGETLYRWRLLSLDGEAVMSSSGLRIDVEARLSVLRDLPALCVLAGYNVENYCSRTLFSGLRRTAGYGCELGGLESGSYALARAGLLDGYTATTHWEDLEDFTRRFRRVNVVPNRFVVDRGRFTAAGAIPSLDLMLHLIQCQHGYALAMEVAGLFIYEQQKLSTDPQRIASLGQLKRLQPRVARAIELMEANLEHPIRITKLANLVGLGQRELERLFRKLFSISPKNYYLGLRLAHGRRLLWETSRTVTEVALACGFGSASAYARALRRHYNQSPTELRRRG